MRSRKVYVNKFGLILAIMASKTAIGATMNASQQKIVTFVKFHPLTSQKE